MKLLYWSDLFWPYVGGIEVLSRKLLPTLAQRGYDITVVTSRGEMALPDRDDLEGIPILRLPFMRALHERDPVGILALRKQVSALKSELDPDITHVNLGGPTGFFHLGTQGNRPSPCVLATHTAIGANKADSSLVVKLLSGADWVTSNSSSMLAAARGLAPQIQGRSSVIYNFVEPLDLPAASLPFRPARLLCLGRLLPKKGFDLALTAFHTLSKRFPEISLRISGDGPARTQLEMQARQLGIGPAVEFVGWTSPERVPALINESTAVIVPSRWEEPFCLVAVEAALMKRPVVGTRVGGLPEVVVDGETGLIVPKDDPRAIDHAVSELLENPSRARAYGEAARTRALSLFSRERYVNAYDALYRQLAGKSSDPSLK